MGKTQNIFKKINQSESLAQCKDDILALAAQSGIRERISDVFETATTDYEIGMAVSKVFDNYGVVPTMKWLPEEIKALYTTPQKPLTEQIKAASSRNNEKTPPDNTKAKSTPSLVR